MAYMKVMTQTGEAYVVMTEVVAMVRHLPNRENFNVDIHMKSGTIFVVMDCNEPDFNAMMDMWEMFNREQWRDPFATGHPGSSAPASRSPGYIKDGRMCEL